MTYVVAEPCVNCRYTDCALVCPVEAFHLDDDMLVINPETCIDCDACVPECPVEAVFAEANVPAEWTSFTPLNAERALSGLPTISARLDPLCKKTQKKKPNPKKTRKTRAWRGSRWRPQCLLEKKHADGKESRGRLGEARHAGDVQG